MGQAIDKEWFDQSDYDVFRQQLLEDLRQLKQVLASPNFSLGHRMLGTELEMSLINDEARPCLANQAILNALQDPLCQPELNQYNLEYNFAPLELKSNVFDKLEQDFIRAIGNVDKIARAHKANVILNGILPSLRLSDLTGDCMTQQARYRALSRGIKKTRQGPFEIDIKGYESLALSVDELTLEGANTSIQIHVQVKDEEFSSWYNAIQMATPLAVAICSNSPIFLEHLLWHETRIPLFKQSVDTRPFRHDSTYRIANRVSFGYGWNRKGAYEYFDELVSLYPPLLPVLEDESSSYGAPSLSALRMHQSSIWRWNRGVYDHHHDGHLRIEMRALPSGPTIKDMIANTVFLLGLAAYLRHHMDACMAAFPFMYAEHNFYRACEHGMNTHLLWPGTNQCSPVSMNARDLALNLLPQVQEGLKSLSLEKDSKQWLNIIKDRLKNGQTGSVWQLAKIQQLDQSMGRTQACQVMTMEYLERMKSNKPVSTWKL